MPRAVLLIMIGVTLAVTAGGILGVQAPTYSHDHQPPKAVLMKGERALQKGYLEQYCWTYPPGPDGSFGGQCADGAPNFPAMDRVSAGSTLHVRIFKVQQPKSFAILAYRKVDERNVVTGRRQDLNISLRPVVQDGETVAWDVFFRVNRPDRHYYLRAQGFWKDEFVDEDQDALWTFHVRTRAETNAS